MTEISGASAESVDEKSSGVAPAAVSPGAGYSSGTVTFLDGSTTLGTGTLAADQATFATLGLTAGDHSITAVYGGDSNFLGSTSSAITQVVDTVTGIPFAAAKGQGFSGAVAAFAPFAGTTLSDYSATILWGDGATSAGTITAAGTLYNVTGSHTYAEEGPYLPSVEVDEPVIGARGAALDFALVVPLAPDTSFVNVASWSLAESGSVTLESGDTGSYNLQAGGNLDYTLSTTDDSIGATSTTTTTATDSFSVQASISSTGSLAVSAYSTSVSGSDTVSQQLTQSDLNTLSTGTATGSDTLTNLSGGGNQSTGGFSWTWNETSTLSPTLQDSARTAPPARPIRRPPRSTTTPRATTGPAASAAPRPTPAPRR